jgi:hypothetical protein
VAPPELKSPEDQDDTTESKISDTKELLLRVHQNLDEAGEEHMKKEAEQEDTPTDASPKESRKPATKPSAAELIGDGDWEDEE